MRATIASRRTYNAWIEDQIEEFKAALTRDELLDLAEEAIESLGDSPEGQYAITEILLRESVDALIFDRLNLPDYRQWRSTCLSDTPGRLLQRTPGSARKVG
jgi:hypothetical protein